MKFKELREKCWPGYKQVGTKKKNGREVPNCVPEENDVVEISSKDVRDKLKKVKGISKKQMELIATLPSPMLTSIVQQLSSLVASKDHCECDPIEEETDAQRKAKFASGSAGGSKSSSKKPKLDEAPLVMSDMDMVQALTQKIEDDLHRLKIKKQFEKGWPIVQALAKLAGYRVTKSGQQRGKTFRYDIKK
jgi:hypothetical protein